MNEITGIININSVNQDRLTDDMFYRGGINLTFDNYQKEHVKFCEDKDCIESEHLNDYENYEECNDTYIVNYIKDDKGLYIPDKSKDYSFVVSESVIQVTYSKYNKRCSLCSPCYPGQGNLDSSGSYLTFTLPDYYLFKERV